MKKVIFLFFLLAVICYMLSGCADNNADVSVIADPAPAQFESEEAFINAIKNGGGQ